MTSARRLLRRLLCVFAALLLALQADLVRGEAHVLAAGSQRESRPHTHAHTHTHTHSSQRIPSRKQQSQRERGESALRGMPTPIRSERRQLRGEDTRAEEVGRKQARVLVAVVALMLAMGCCNVCTLCAIERSSPHKDVRVLIDLRAAEDCELADRSGPAEKAKDCAPPLKERWSFLGNKSKIAPSEDSVKPFAVGASCFSQDVQEIDVEKAVERERTAPESEGEERPQSKGGDLFAPRNNSRSSHRSANATTAASSHSISDSHVASNK